MEFVQLGASHLQLSRIGLGCEPLGGTDWGKFDLDLAVQAVTRCVNSGINVFDTADIYGLGQSEERLSYALGDARSSSVIISKCGIRSQPNPDGLRAETFLDGSADWTLQAVEGSLRRLRLEAIPLYLVHRPDPKRPLAETIETLERCRLAGKIRYIGVSNFSTDQLKEANQIAPLTVAEVQYNLLDRQAEAEILPLCNQLGIAVVAYGPLAQGLLTATYGAAARFDSDDRRHRLAHFQPEALERNLMTVRRLQEIADKRGRSPAQVALRWVLDSPAVASVIVGAKSPEQVTDNLGALGWKLEPAERAYLNG